MENPPIAVRPSVSSWIRDFFARGDFAGSLERVTSLDCEDWLKDQLRGYSLCFLGQRSKAYRCWRYVRQQIAAHPENFDPTLAAKAMIMQREQAILDADLATDQEADELLRRALREVNSDCERKLLSRAITLDAMRLMVAGELESALTMLAILIVANRSSPQSQHSLWHCLCAICEIALEQYERADRNLELAVLHVSMIEFNLTRICAHERIARVYDMLGDRVLAAEHRSMSDAVDFSAIGRRQLHSLMVTRLAQLLPPAIAPV